MLLPLFSKIVTVEATCTCSIIQLTFINWFRLVSLNPTFCRHTEEDQIIQKDLYLRTPVTNKITQRFTFNNNVIITSIAKIISSQIYIPNTVRIPRFLCQLLFETNPFSQLFFQNYCNIVALKTIFLIFFNVGNLENIIFFYRLTHNSNL